MAQHEKVEFIVSAALEAFWAVIAAKFPEADSGDLSPAAFIAQNTACENAVKEWIQNNVKS